MTIRRFRARRGATLIELLVALLLLDLALLSLASMSAVAVRRLGDAGRRHRAAVAASNRLERLAGRPCNLAVGGSAVLEPNVLESWDVRAQTNSIEATELVDIRAPGGQRIVARTRIPC